MLLSSGGRFDEPVTNPTQDPGAVLFTMVYAQ